MAEHELIVVGGGPIGLATAIEARLAGMDVTVVEPRVGSIDKACGEGLMPGALSALVRLGVDPAGFDVAGIAYMSGTARVEHRFSGGMARGVRRTVLHDSLGARADELGVRRMVGKAVGLAQDSRSVTVLVQAGARTGAAGTRQLRGSWVIACDGLHSTVRRLVDVEGHPQSVDRRRYGLRQHFRVQPWSDVVEVYWADDVEFYVTPVDALTVGIAMLGPARREFGEALAGVHVLGERLAGAQPLSELRGAGPLRQKSTHRVAGRVLLAGDASGYVDALTGEGLRVGLAQARAAVHCVIADTPGEYERRWRHSTREFRLLTTALVAAARSPWRARIVPAAVAAPTLFGALVERLAR